MKNLLAGLFLLCNGGISVYAQFCLTAPAGYISGIGPTDLCIADLNGDTYPDMIATNQGNGTLAVFINNGKGSYTSSAINTGSSPISVTAADFNGDSAIDLAATSSSSYIFILINNKKGGYTITNLTTSGGHGEIESGDFNEDGKADIIVLNPGFSDQVSVYPGKGDGTFNLPENLTVGNGPTEIFIRDINKDNHSDLLILTKGSSSISILTGSGDGSFTPETPVSVPNYPDFFHVSDFNGDNIWDLVVSYQNRNSDNILVIPGNGKGGFGNPVATTSVYAGSMASADFDRDGKMDLVLGAGRSMSVSNIVILTGKNDGTFSDQVVYTSIMRPWKLITGDFNRDGRPDLSVINNQDGYLDVYFNFNSITSVEIEKRDVTCYGTGDGMVKATAKGSGGPFTYRWTILANTHVGDSSSLVNIAGNVYKVTVTGTGNCRMVKEVEVFEPNPITIDLFNTNISCGGGAFTNLGSKVAGGTPPYTYMWNEDPQLTDSTLNGLKSGNYTLEVTDSRYCRNTVKTTVVDPLPYQPSKPFEAGSRFMELADMNGDGYNDLITIPLSGNKCFIFISNGNGQFKSPITVSGINAGYIGIFKTGDFNNDSKKDLLLTTYEGIFVFPGDGKGGVGTPVLTKLSGIYSETGVIADFNNDQKIDLVLYDYPSLSIKVYAGKGDGTFLFGNSMNQNSVNAMEALDYNSDGYMDLIVPATKSLFFKGNGTLSFAAPWVSNITLNTKQFKTADMNKDGITDLISSNYTTMYVVFGNGKGLFENPKYIQTGIAPYDFSLADINLDGIPDVVNLNPSSPGVTVVLSTGDGGFAAPSHWPNPRFNKKPLISDVNADGVKDIIVFSESDSSLIFMSCSAISSVKKISADSVGIFPNPARTSFRVTLTKPHVIGHMELVNSAGQKVWNRDGVFSAEQDVPVDQLPEGLYFLIISDSRNHRTINRVSVYHP